MPYDGLEAMASPARPGGSTLRAAAGGRPRFRRADAAFLLVAAAVIVLDQVSKHLVRANLSPGESFPEEGLLRITNVSNTGAAFGIFQGQTFFLIAATFVGLGTIALYYLYPPMEHAAVRLALGLQLGGAIGNLADRLRAGRVTDFIDFRFWPAFNVADSSIVIGVSIIVGFFLLLESLSREKQGRSAPPDPP